MALDIHRNGIIKKGLKSKLEDEEELLMKSIVTPEYIYDPLEVLGERSFNEPREVPVDEIGTPVQEFYRDATIFLTGGTGFMGKVLMEKLLRTCPHIKHIYVLVRAKHGKPPLERIDATFQDRLYKRLKHEVPKYYHKVTAINGDIALPGLGMSESNRNKIINEVNIILHGAATVRFDEKIQVAININVLGTREMIKLAKQVKNLKVMMYVSTAYAYCVQLRTEEKFYDIPVPYEEVIKRVKSITDAKELERLTPEIIGKWPNTYTFTKALAENLVRNEAKGLPIGVYRPGTIISTYMEPVRGWIDNVYGPVGMFVGIGTGVLHVYEDTHDVVTDVVPVDFVVNGFICSAVNTAKVMKIDDQNKEPDIPIYTYSSAKQNPPRWKEMLKASERFGHNWPTIRAVWYYSLTAASNKYTFALMTFLYHVIPGYIIDAIAVLTGRKPMLTKIYKKLGDVNEILRYFMHRQFDFTNDNVQKLWSSLTPEDQQLFCFDITKVSWDKFCESVCIGLRVYLVNDDIHTLPAARKKWKRLYYAHCALRTIFWSFVFYLLWCISELFLRIFS